MEDISYIIKLLLAQIFILLFLAFLIIISIKIKNKISLNKKFKKYTIDSINKKYKNKKSLML